MLRYAVKHLTFSVLLCHVQASCLILYLCFNDHLPQAFFPRFTHGQLAFDYR